MQKFVCHSKKVLSIARQYDWLCGARYTNLRDVKHEDYLGFLDIDWKNYSFSAHLDAAMKFRPILTIARDIEKIEHSEEIIRQAELLRKFSDYVAIVPKDPALGPEMDRIIPDEFLLAYSVPTRYGGTSIPCHFFGNRPVHLLGGRPDIQWKLGQSLNVVSIDTNRFTIDAAFGDYFDGEKFRPHPIGGYVKCLEDSLRNINLLWKDYHSSSSLLLRRNA